MLYSIFLTYRKIKRCKAEIPRGKNPAALLLLLGVQSQNDRAHHRTQVPHKQRLQSLRCRPTILSNSWAFRGRPGRYAAGSAGAGDVRLGRLPGLQAVAGSRAGAEAGAAAALLQPLVNSVHRAEGRPRPLLARSIVVHVRSSSPTSLPTLGMRSSIRLLCALDWILMLYVLHRNIVLNIIIS